MGTLEEIRAKLLAAENKKEQYTNQDTLTFRHWEINEGESAVVRFLPDGDTSNEYFWRERQQIELTFNGVVGGDSKEVRLRVPCMETWGESCPIINETRPWWNDPSLEDLARKYWKKRSYLMQGFVIDSPITEDSPSENPIRKFVISPQIFNIIKSTIKDEEELSALPTDYENGLNFTINKTVKGKYADYTTSKFARRETPLTSEQLSAIDQFGLFDLGSWLPAKPTPEGVTVIQEMFHASVNGEQYDPQRWGQFYRPYGMPAPVSNPTTITYTETPSSVGAVEVKKSEPVAESEPVTESASSGDTGSSAADILAKIRARSAE